MRCSTPSAMRDQSCARRIIPLTQFGSMAAMPLLILGLILNTSTLVTIGIAAFGLSTLFQLVTLPVELDASRRALQTIQQNGLLTADEYPMAKRRSQRRR